MKDKSKETIPTTNKTIVPNKIQTDETSLATNPALLPVVEEYEDKVSMYNTAELNSIGSRKYVGKLDQITGTVELMLDGGTGGSIVIRKIKNTKHKLNNNPLKIFGPSTEKLFRYIIVQLTEQTLYKEKVSGMTETIKIEVAKYQKIIGRKDYNSAREQIEKGLEIIYSCSLRFKGIKTYRGSKKKKKKYDSALVDARIITRKAHIEWGVFYIEISTDIVSHLMNSDQIMQLHKYYWKASGVASEILYKVSSLARINKKKLKNKKSRLLKTTTMLKAIPSLPTYEYAMKHNDGHTGRRIIKPLEEGLEELEEQKIIKWEYCNKKGKRLTKEQLGIEEKHLKDKKRVKTELDWKAFSEIYLKISLI
jgi:hypothetical protein